jgi:hypothetical protein
MLTNPFETQLVRSLGVKVGGRPEPPAPFEHLRSSIAHQRHEAFSAPTREHAQFPEGPEAEHVTHDSERPGCPFADMVADRESHDSAAIEWSPEAAARVERIPSFIRPMARKAIERYADGKGYRLVTEAVMDEARTALGM